MFCEVFFGNEQFGGNEQKTFVETNSALCRDSDKLTIFTEGGGVAKGWSDDAIIIAPFIKVDVLLLLGEPLGHFPVNL